MTAATSRPQKASPRPDQAGYTYRVAPGVRDELSTRSDAP